MRVERIRKLHWALGTWVAVFLEIAALALPGGVQGAANTCNTFIAIALNTPFNFLNVNDVATVTLAPGNDGIQNGTKVTINRLRYELDCAGPSALPCTDQGAIFEYEGDSTISTTCAGVTWTSNVPAGGSATNDMIFTPSPPISINAGVPPNPATCGLSFKVKLLSLEPTSGPLSDSTPHDVEVDTGFLQAKNDAVCDNGLAAGGTQPGTIGICPSCTVDQCNLGCDQTAGTCKAKDASTPCTDTDGNSCTTAGCELNGSGVGVCVQTHLFASNSTPCADADGNACTTAGCDGQGVCDQNHASKVCPPADECNGVCDTTSGQCTPKVSTPCTDTDGDVCTLAGCELSPTNPDLGVCVQTHMFASDSTPCPDTDNDACTTAGCEAGSCVQTHLAVTCPPGTNTCFAQQCNSDTGMCEDTGGTNGGFPFLVRSEGKVGNDSQVLASFGANDAGGHLTLGKRAFVSDGNTVAGDSVNLLINTNVFDVLANQLHEGTGVTIRGAVGTPVLPLTNPFCPIPPLDCTGGVDQIVPPKATLTLGPGTYGQFVVRNGGTLILTPAGTFTFCSLQTTRGVTIVVSGATPSTINVVGSFRLANVSSMLPVNTTPTPSLNVGGGRLRIGAGSTIQAFISAPSARGAFGRKSTIAGRFCVDSNQSDKGITMMCPTTTTTSVATTTTTQPPG